MSVWDQVSEEIEKFMRDIPELPVMQQVSPSTVRNELESRYDFRQGVPLQVLTGDVMRLLRQWSIHVTHPRYFGLFNPSIRPAGIVADALVALYNPQLAVWSHAPAANEIERVTLRHFSKALGLDPNHTFANFTGGGAEANLSGVLAALAHFYPSYGEQGAAGIRPQPKIYLTGECHHSFVKIARMTGIGTASLRQVETNECFLMDCQALERHIEEDQRAGFKPLLVVGTAGTTGAGLIDPLERIADLAEKYRIWFHADAAWGGSAALSDRLRPALKGIERADSIIWDAHKWLSVPMGAGMFFCRHPEAVQRAFAVEASYMPPKTYEETIDSYAATTQWSRRLIGLKVFMNLAELGTEGYGKLIEQQARIGEYLRLRLRATGWMVINETPFPLVCFVHPEMQDGRYSTADILKVVYERGRVWISDVVLGGRENALRACITSYRTAEPDIECLLEELEFARQRSIHRREAKDGRQK